MSDNFDWAQKIILKAFLILLLLFVSCLLTINTSVVKDQITV